MYSKHWLFSFGGTFTGASGPDEIWQSGIRGVPAAGATLGYGDEDAILGFLEPKVTNWFTADTGARMRSDAKLVWIKLNQIGPDGKYLEPVTHVRYLTAPVAGAGSSALPPFLTLAVTWRTAKQRGPGSKGRVYLPFEMSASTDGRVGGVTTMYAQKGADLLVDLTGNPAAEGFLIGCKVASKVDGSLNDITAVACGDVIDVQRRRKSALKEAYTVVTF